ncbi:conserved exported hypothetical protein [Candidatus Desulfarcum epimagneticum]|uniref:Auto-transporter adhesin head GIN domain-containing protein n=1 Tax=uncultured Desulfobacteraceae bacterium TaxID=218296 RepID=A0A484HH30_9BACT|nr:conserved exported hypothetical protein [uncultured Desulfobacteraceae bacterium]
MRPAISKSRKIPVILICLAALRFALSSHAGEDMEDLIDIVESKSEIIAIIQGKKTVSIDLQTDEKVLWSGSKGDLGAALTPSRFLTISPSSNGWRSLPLKLEESKEASASLSSDIALLSTRNRVAAFDAASSRFVETPIPLHDERIAAKADTHIAVAVTSSRALALATGNSSFSKIRLGLRETIGSIKTASGKAMVRTSDRLLIFEAQRASWNERRLD